MTEHKAYYAIIPANVRYDNDLTPNAKLLYGEITALCNEKGYCWASNEYFSNLYSVSKTSISKWVSSLAEKGYIEVKLIYKEGTKQILNRYITIVNNPIEQKLKTPLTKVKEPIKEKLKENNTVNITSNNTNNKKERKKGTNYDTIIDERISNAEVKETLIEFIKMRKMIKSPLTDRALTMLINRLEGMSQDAETQIAILEQSIINSWKNIYDLKEEAKKAKPAKVVKTDLDREIDEFFN